MNGTVANALVDAENACLSAVGHAGATGSLERERVAKRRICEAFDELRAVLKGQFGPHYQGKVDHA